MSTQTHDASALLAKIPSTIPPDTPVTMLNLISFHAEAQYPRSSPHYSSPPLSGREAYYTGYITAFGKLANLAGGYEVVYLGKPNAILVGAAGPASDAAAAVAGSEVDPDGWDVVALVRYANIEVFKDTLGSEEYKRTALPHRDAAIRDWRLWVTTEMQLGT